MHQASQHLLVPERLGSASNHLTFAKGETAGVVSPSSARELGKLPGHCTLSLEKLSTDQDQNDFFVFSEMKNENYLVLVELVKLPVKISL